jgi:hypothetical protein
MGGQRSSAVLYGLKREAAIRAPGAVSQVVMDWQGQVDGDNPIALATETRCLTETRRPYTAIKPSCATGL